MNLPSKHLTQNNPQTSEHITEHQLSFFLNQSEVIETLQQCQHWEDKYRQVIQWGKKLPVMPEEARAQSALVSGCESEVWLKGRCEDGLWLFEADSDARIVRGLIAILLAAYFAKTREQIADLNVEDYFEQIGLLSHLSESRNQGLRAIVKAIQTLVS